MKPLDLKELEKAVNLLENPGFIARLTSMLGSPIDWVMEKLPAMARNSISEAVNIAIQLALKVAILTMSSEKSSSSPWWHRFSVGISGALGGFFGLAGLPYELPISTAIMLRSIADIARSEGEEINTPEAQLACIMVFALGGNHTADDATESGYYATRIALSKALAEATEFIAKKGIVEEGAPAIVRFVARVASRFEVVVSEKVTVEAAPIIGAASGAAINVLFINHFMDMAKGHFIVRRLERKYGEKTVRDTYQTILNKRSEL